MQRVLGHAIRQVVAQQPVAVPLLQRFHGVYLQDSNTVALPEALKDRWPGCGGRNADQNQAAIKFQVRLDLCGGQLSGPLPQPGRTADVPGSAEFDPLPRRSLLLADLGYFSLDWFAALDEQGVFWLSLWQPGTVLLTPDGRRLDLAAELSRATTAVVDREVRAGAERRLACRLVALRVSADEARWRREALRKHAQKKGQVVTAERLALCHWTIHLTNLPRELVDASEIETLRRSRGQIELRFKLWKSDGGLERSRIEDPDRVL